jgi:calcineurin-like phosphoesterase family protein
MPQIFFTSDTHFNHEKIIELCGRPFASVEEMDDTMIANWNGKIGRGDIVYHLGDFTFSRRKEEVERYLRKLNGQIHLVLGNHDHRQTRNAQGWAWQGHYKEITVGDQRIVLSHYAMRTWHGSHKGAWMLYGHSHGTVRRDWQVRSFDVGVDLWNFTPLSFEEIEDQLSKVTPRAADLLGAKEQSEPQSPPPPEA